MIAKATIATAVLAATAVASPTFRNTVVKRFADGEDCTSDTVATEGKPGLFFAVDSSGTTVDCDEANEASTEKGYTCYVTNKDTEDLGDYAKCPKDPAPKKNPDGSETNIGEALIDTYCKNAGGPAWINAAGCMIFGYFEAKGDPVKEAEAGAVGICDAIFSGACTWFTSIAPDLAKGMDLPCHDDPGSNACDFIAPG